MLNEKLDSSLKSFKNFKFYLLLCCEVPEVQMLKCAVLPVTGELAGVGAYLLLLLGFNYE